MNDVESPTYEERLLASALTHEQLGEHWPEAACLFDWACPDLAGKPVVFLVVKGRLRVQLVSEYAPRTRAYWDGRCGVWVRYSAGSCQTPHAEPGRYEGESYSEYQSAAARVLQDIEARRAARKAESAATYARNILVGDAARALAARQDTAALEPWAWFRFVDQCGDYTDGELRAIVAGGEAPARQGPPLP